MKWEMDRGRNRETIEPLSPRRCRAKRAEVDDETQSSDESGRNTFDAIMTRRSSDNRLHGNRVAKSKLTDNLVCGAFGNCAMSMCHEGKAEDVKAQSMSIAETNR